MKRGKELIGNTLIIAIGNFSTKIISFFLLPLYTTILTTSDYGTYDLLVTIATFLIPIITMLMEESMFRFLIDCKTEEKKTKVISQATIYSLISTIVFCVLIFIISLFINFPYKYLFILYIFSLVCVALRNAITRGLSKIKLFSLSNFINSLLTIILNIYFIAVLKIGVKGLFLAYIFSALITSFYVFYKIGIRKYINFRKLEKKKTIEMLKYSIPLVPNSISWGIINLSDRIIVSTLIGSSANGIYSMSYKFPTIMDTVYGFFYTAWKESAAKTVKDSDSEEFYNKIYDALKNFMWSVTIVIISLIPFIFNILVKKEFASAYLYIPILMVAMYYSNISGFYGGIFSAFKETKIMGISTVVGAILNISIDLFLIKYIGIWAAAVSTLISTFCVYLLRKIKIKKFTKLNENYTIYIFNNLILLLVMFSYYSKNSYYKLISLLIVVLYSSIINKKVIFVLFKSMQLKLLKNK